MTDSVSGIIGETDLLRNPKSRGMARTIFLNQKPHLTGASVIKTVS